MLGFGSVAQYSVADAGQQGTRTTLVIDAGSLTLTGQDIGLDVTLPVAAGALTLSGGTFQNWRVNIEAGTLTLDGGDVDLDVTFSIEPATLTLTGQDLPVEVTLPIEAGQLTLTGGEIVSYRVTIEAGQLTLSGDVPLFPSIAIEAGQLRLTPHDITLFGFGGGGSDRQAPRARKIAPPFVRMIEVIEDGRPKKVPLLERFAPPPPPPPLVLAPDWLGQPQVDGLRPLDLPRIEVFDSAQLQEELEVQDALAALMTIPDPAIEAARDLIATHAVIGAIPDDAMEAVREFAGDFVERLLEEVD